MGLVEEYLKLANDVVSFRELVYDEEGNIFTFGAGVCFIGVVCYSKCI